MNSARKDDSQSEVCKNSNFFKVPKLYRDSARILGKYNNKEGSLQKLIYETKHQSDYKRLYAVLSKVVCHYSEIEKALIAVKLFEEQPRFNRDLAFILTSEVLRKNSSLNGNCKPVIVINTYEKKLRDILKGHQLESEKLIKKFPKYVRINTLLQSEEEIYLELEKLGARQLKYNRNETSYDEFLSFVETLDDVLYMKDYHVPNLLVFSPHQEFWNTDMYKENRIIIQDKASCLPAFLSGVKPGDSVIDACAAPGNKTSHLASVMHGEGRLIAIDQDWKRYETLVRHLSMRGVTSAETLRCDFTSVHPANYEDIRVIIVDPSCSASGTNVHNDELIEERLLRLSNFQFKVLSHALSFPSVEAVVYSTCSIRKEENEEVVAQALRNFGSLFHLEDLSSFLHEWKHFGSSEYEFGSQCIRTDSSVDKCQGFFVAKFVRNDVKIELLSAKKKLKHHNDSEKSNLKCKKRKMTKKN